MFCLEQPVYLLLLLNQIKDVWCKTKSENFEPFSLPIFIEPNSHQYILKFAQNRLQTVYLINKIQGIMRKKRSQASIHSYSSYLLTCKLLSLQILVDTCLKQPVDLLRFPNEIAEILQTKYSLDIYSFKASDTFSSLFKVSGYSLKV